MNKSWHGLYHVFITLLLIKFLNKAEKVKNKLNHAHKNMLFLINEKSKRKIRAKFVKRNMMYNQQIFHACNTTVGTGNWTQTHAEENASTFCMHKYKKNTYI